MKWFRRGVYHPAGTNENRGVSSLLTADDIPPDPGVDRLALLRGAEGEDLDLRELVDPVQPAGVPASGPGLGPEAVRQPDVPLRQLALFKDLVAVHPAQRDLGGGDEAQVGVGDGVHLP